VRASFQRARRPVRASETEDLTGAFGSDTLQQKVKKGWVWQ
jgi:hypothetical protein